MKSSSLKKINLKRAVLIIVISAFTVILSVKGYGYWEYSRKITYAVNDNLSEKRMAHISIDDTINLFDDITKNKNEYNSIFDNKTLDYFKLLHDKYNIVISCYVYYENDDKTFNLSQCTDKFQKEFEENSSWLKFGFHALNGKTDYSNMTYNKASQDYNKVIKQLLRITGTNKCIDNVIRISGYKGNRDCVRAFIKAQNGISGLLSADDDRKSYYFSSKENLYLSCHDFYYDKENNIYVFPTDIRIENINNIKDELDSLSDEGWKNKTGIFILFTHEWKLNDPRIKKYMEKCIEYCVYNKYSFEFPEDIVKNKEII